MPTLYFLEGGVAVGKSTLLETIQKHLDCQVVHEPLDVWTRVRDGHGKNLLEKFYEDPKAHAYAFQSFAFMSRAKIVGQLQLDKPVVLIERSVHSDKLFAENCYETGLMSELEWNLYGLWYDWIVAELWALRGDCTVRHIYLRCSPTLALERLKRRRRREEESIDPRYLARLHEKHDERFKESDDTWVFDAETDAETLAARIKARITLASNA